MSVDLTLDKQISADGGHTWLDVGSGNLAQDPTVLAGSTIEERVFLVNTGSVGISNLGATDVGGNGPAAFLFGGAETVSLAAGATLVSDIATISAGDGYQLDTATAVRTASGFSLTLTATDQANYTGVTPAIAIDKQISADGGKTWVEIGDDNLTSAPTVLAGSSLEERVIVTNTGSIAIGDASVSDANQPGVTGFDFGGASTFSLAAGGTIISDMATITANSGVTDTATVTGTASDSFGNTQTVSASDQAVYATETPSITIDKQISADGGKTWVEIGDDNLTSAPTVLAGSSLEERVIVVNTASIAIGNASVSDANQPGLSGFDFGGASTLAIAAGATITSDVATITANSGVTDTATVTGTASDSYGNTETISASDQVVYGIKAQPSTIAGTAANQPTTDEATIHPFASVTIADPNGSGATETVTVTPSSTANGTLSDPNAGADGGIIGNNGAYTVSGSASAVTTALDGLVFTPAAHEVAPGQAVTTGFTISDTNSANQATTDSTTSVVATAVNDAPTLAAPTLSYSVGEGQTLQGLYDQLLANAQDVDHGDQAQLTISSIGDTSTMGFLYFDPTDKLLTYTANGANAKAPTDSFNYTVSDPHGALATGTVDLTVTGASPTVLGTPGADTLTANGSGALVFAGAGDDTITVNGAKSTVYGGTGTNAITLHGAQETVALQQGGTDQISGFKLHGGDMLDLRPALDEAQINLGGDFSQIGNYVQVASSGNDATLSLNPSAQVGGSGPPLAVLHGVGSGVTLNTLISDHVLQIS